MNRAIAPLNIKPSRPELLQPFLLEHPSKKVFCFNNPGCQVIRLEIMFRSGYLFQEKPLQAAFMAAMLNESTVRHTAEQMASRIDFLGASIHAETGNYSHIVSVFCTVKVLPEVLIILEEMFKEPLFSEDDFTIMLNTAKQRFLINQKKVDHVSRQYFSAELFGKETILGHLTSLEDYSNLTASDLKNHYEKHFSKGWTTALIAGDLQKETIDLLTEFFNKNNYFAAEPKVPFEFNVKSVVKTTIPVEDAIQCGIKIGFKAVSKEHKDYPDLQLANMILGGYFGSRLMTNIREDKGYTYGIGSSLIPMYKAGYIGVSTEVGADVCEAALEEIHKEIKLMCTEKVKQDELDLARNYLVGSFIRNSDGVFAMADRFSGIYDYDLDYSFYDNYFDRINAITPDDILLICQKYFDNPFVQVVAGK